jgi:gelsolin
MLIGSQVVDMLGGENTSSSELTAKRPVLSSDSKREDSIGASPRSKKLLKISDASGDIGLDLVKDGDDVDKNDLDSNDVFIYDTGRVVWVWEGQGASRQEKAMWIKVAQSYIRKLQNESANEGSYLIPVAKVTEGNESPAFLRAFG